jgi:glycolate oxidase
MFERAPELGGRWSGAPGIGPAKSKFLEKEFGRGTILYSNRLKTVVASNPILNPGRIFGE